MNVIVSLATNDDRGNDTGKVSAIQLGEAIDLHWGEMGSEPRYLLKDGTLKIQRKTFPITGKQEWYGNWCWTGVAMHEKTAAELLNHLTQDDRWHCEGGWCDLTDAYTEGKVTPDMLKEIQG